MHALGSLESAGARFHTESKEITVLNLNLLKYSGANRCHRGYEETACGPATTRCFPSSSPARDLAGLTCGMHSTEANSYLDQV